LQKIADDGMGGWGHGRVEGLKSAFIQELQRRGVSVMNLEASGQKVIAALKNALTDDRGRWVLGTREEARNEYRVRVCSPEGRRTLIMDRVFCDTDGVEWIVDYKTSGHEGTDAETFLDRELHRYGEQMALYASALKGSRQGLYFPLLRSWRERGIDASNYGEEKLPR
jgi:hypothetical protein